MFSQIYNPLNSTLMSALVAAIPIIVLLGAIAFLRIKAHVAALLGLIASLAVAIFVFGMPSPMAGVSAVFGAAYGLMPIGWIILNVIFLYQLTVEKGYFDILKSSIGAVTRDRRLQLVWSCAKQRRDLRPGRFRPKWGQTGRRGSHRAFR